MLSNRQPDVVPRPSHLDVRKPEHFKQCMEIDKVLLDGVEQLNAVAFCTIDNWVERFKTDETGGIIFAGEGDDVAIERVRGSVRIIWK